MKFKFEKETNPYFNFIFVLLKYENVRNSYYIFLFSKFITLVHEYLEATRVTVHVNTLIRLDVLFWKH